MLRVYLSAFLYFVIALSAKPQTTVILTAVKDNTIYQDGTGNSNGSGQNLFAGTTGPGGGNSARRALLKFDLSGIPALATISSATLTLYCNKTTSGPSSVKIHKLLADWGEGSSDAGGNEGAGIAAAVNDATWLSRINLLNLWALPGGDFSAIASATTSIDAPNTSYTWSSPAVIADVQSWVTAPLLNFGWIIIGDESIASTAKRFASRENPTVAQRPRLSVTYSSIVPVVLSSFTAKEIKNGALLNWTTAQELNNAFFLIEHSIDGIHFSEVGKVTGFGTSQISNSYQFKHEAIAAGRHYYRLAQTDLDGKVQYSPVKTLNTGSQSFSLQISPNPVIDRIVLQSSVNRSGNQYAIRNSTGKLVVSGVLNNNAIDVKHLATGTYYLLVLQKDGEALTGTFLKH
ncbi:MAG: DNRLRE domain-containing protein [Ferruginibacter sp.]